MNRVMTTSLMILTTIVLLTAVLSATASPLLEALRQTPADTLDANRLRVWIPVEGSSRCRMVVHIKDSTGQVVRNLLDELLTRGYHNFYWDKRDDSGRYVGAGEYRFESKGCGKTRQGRLEATYAPGELESEIALLDSVDGAHFEWHLMSDSAIVNAYVENARGNLIDSVYSNHVAFKGAHTLEWSPPPGYAGRFVLCFRVDRYTHRVPFRLQGSRRQKTSD